MRMSALIAVAVLMTAADARETPSKDEIEASARKVQELQKERIAVLNEAVAVSTVLVENGRLDGSALLDDRMALLEAELDAAETVSERISLYTKAVDWLKEGRSWRRPAESVRGGDRPGHIPNQSEASGSRDPVGAGEDQGTRLIGACPSPNHAVGWHWEGAISGRHGSHSAGALMLNRSTGRGTMRKRHETLRRG